MRATTACGTIGVLVFLAGCGEPRDPIPERAALEQADSMELFALDPTATSEFKAPKEADTVGFHGWPVLRRAPVGDAAERRAVARAVVQGWRRNDGRPFKCFEPRHGVRVTQSGRTVDFLICFACKSAEVHADGRWAGSFLTADSGRELLDRLLAGGTAPADPRQAVARFAEPAPAPDRAGRK